MHRCMLACMQTTVRVDTSNRDALARFAREVGAVSLDEALRVLLFRYDTMRAVEALRADPDALAAYQAEAAELADVDVALAEW